MNKELENKILEVADLIYNIGYTAGSAESGFDAGYKYGLRDAWETARKLIHDASNNYVMIDEIFGDCSFGDCSVDFIIINDSIEDVLSRIKNYEKKDICNTCVHKNEDNICCGCVNNSEYEEEPKQTEKRCIDCRHNTTSAHCLLRVDGGRCVDKDKWELKQTEQTEEQPKQSCEDCVNKNTCSLKCPEHVKANGCRSWIPKQTNNQIKLGDEVIHETGSKGIVVGIGNGTLYLLMRDYDMPQKVSKEGYTRTGRYFPQIQELRNQLR